LDNKQQEGKFAEEEEHWREQRDGSDDDDEEYTNLSVQLSTIAEASEEDDPDSPDKFTHSRRALLAAEEPLASGMRACQARDFETAIRCFQRCLSINPKHFKAHFNKGFALHQLGRIDEAIESYTQALSFDTQSAFCYYNRGIARDRKGELQPAVLDFTRAITLCQEGEVPPNFYHNRGYSFSKLGRYDEALQDYDHAIALNPSHFRSYINRALAVEQLAGRETNEGRRTEALEKCVLDYTRALQLRPQSVVTLEARSLVLQKLEQFKVALKDITNAIKLTQKQRDANSASQISDAGGRETQKRTADKLSLLLAGLIKTRALFWVKLGRIESEKEAGDGRDAKAALAMRARALEELTAALDVVFRIGGATGGEGRGGICLLAEQQCNAVGSLYYERGQVHIQAHIDKDIHTHT
jgi:tetratricopeptide (TPR) repeat protein